MTEPITFKTRTLANGANTITVTDTDGDNKTPAAGTNSVMTTFDKNDKVKVTGDASVFTQQEIKDAFFNGYDTTDTRDIKDLTKTDLQLKDGKISGDTTKEFRLEDLAKAVNTTEPPKTVNSTVPNTNFIGDMNQTLTGPDMAFTMTNLTNQVSNYLGYPMTSSIYQPSFSNMNMNSIQDMAKNIFNTVLAKIQNQPNKNTTSQTPVNNSTTPTTAANSATVNGTTPNTPAANQTTTETKAVVTEGVVKEETAKTAEEKKKDTEVKNAKIKAEKEKKAKEQAAIKYDGKNIYGQDLRKYTDKDGNRIVEKYKNGKLVEKDTYHIKNLTIGSTSFKANSGMTAETHYTSEKTLAKPQLFNKENVIPTYGN